MTDLLWSGSFLLLRILGVGEQAAALQVRFETLTGTMSCTAAGLRCVDMRCGSNSYDTLLAPIFVVFEIKPNTEATKAFSFHLIIFCFLCESLKLITNIYCHSLFIFPSSALISLPARPKQQKVEKSFEAGRVGDTVHHRGSLAHLPVRVTCISMFPAHVLLLISSRVSAADVCVPPS